MKHFILTPTRFFLMCLTALLMSANGAFATPNSPADDGGIPGTVPLYRLYNGFDHLYTTSEVERKKAMADFGYKNDEGITGYVFPTKVQGSVPLYRLYNGRDHLYTTSDVERKKAMAEFGYTTDEGIAGYIFP